MQSPNLNTVYANSAVLRFLLLSVEEQVFEGNSPPGHIKIDSVMKALTTYGSEQLTEEQAHDLVSQLEPDHNGMVNYVEYINMVRATMTLLRSEGVFSTCIRRTCHVAWHHLHMVWLKASTYYLCPTS